MERWMLITGAASGIGRATARLFADKGWRLGLYDLDETGLAALADEIEAATDRRPLAEPLDVTEAEAVRAATERFGQASGGRLDVLFLSAGIAHMGPFDEVPLESHRRTVEVNCLGVLHGAHAALPLLTATPRARILLMGSASGLYGAPDIASYSASKFFIRGLTEALDIELAGKDVAVTDLMPSFVDTPLVRDQRFQPASMNVLGVKLGPEDVAREVWKVVHRRRRTIHRVPQLLVRTLNYLAGVFPFTARPTMKILSRK